MRHVFLLALALPILLCGCSTKKTIVTSENRKDVYTRIDTFDIDPLEKKVPLALKAPCPSAPSPFKNNVSELGVITFPTWTKDLKRIVRSQPVADSKYIFIQTTRNELICLNIKTGAEVWRHVGIPSEHPTLPLGAKPCLVGSVIVATFDSGEVGVFDRESGAPLWTDIALSSDMMQGQSPQITASPIVEGKNLYVISTMPFMACYNLDTGEKIWSREVSAIETPLLAGTYLFVLSQDGTVYAINKNTGKLRWQQKVQNAKALKLADGKLALESACGKITKLDPSKGHKLP